MPAGQLLTATLKLTGLLDEPGPVNDEARYVPIVTVKSGVEHERATTVVGVRLNDTTRVF